MRISNLGEFSLIERFRKRIKTDSSVVKGSGDDCAVIKFTKVKHLLFSCDMIAEGVDFTLKDNPYLVGKKALAESISDIAACGGIPRYAVVALGLPKNISLRTIDKIAQGIFDLAREFKINIVGGDISRAAKLIFDVSILGEVEKKCCVLRGGAKRGDIIFVSGELGGSIRGKHLSFIPRIKEARYLVKNFKVNSMIDISDGLAGDLGHILKQSKVGAVIYEDLIPVSKEARGLKDALYMGEDFELLFTLPLKEARRLLKKKLAIFRPIGKIVDKKPGLVLIDTKNREKKIASRGFQHFY